MKRFYIPTLVLTVCVVILLVNDGLTQTLVSGNVSGIWTVGQSPFIVTNHVTVPADSALTIEPGVKVKFRGHYKFTVNGLLKAVGTERDSIFFIRENPTEQNRWWALRFENSDSLNKNIISYCYFEGGKAEGTDSREHRGGAIVCYSSNLKIHHSMFINNQSISVGGQIAGGGAIYVTGSSTFIIENSHFNNNSGSGDTHGGALLINSKNVNVSHCSFINNTADFGGAIAVWDFGGIISNCLIDSNRARYQGGGIYLGITIGPIEVKHNIIRRNWTYDVGVWSGHGGGGILIYQKGIIKIHHNLIIGNSTVRYGGGINCYDSSPVIYNNTIYGNIASMGAGGLRSVISSPTGLNNIFWNNNATHEIDGNFLCTYSDIQGGYIGTGNINADPLFIDPLNENFYLLSNSPCIDAGDPNSPLDPDGTISDIGAFYFDQSGLSKSSQILFVKDVPNDQGGKVTLKWQASALDSNLNKLLFYSIWRALPEGIPAQKSITSLKDVTEHFEGPAYRIKTLNGRKLCLGMAGKSTSASFRFLYLHRSYII